MAPEQKCSSHSLFTYLWPQVQIFMVTPFLDASLSAHTIVFVISLVTLIRPSSHTLRFLALASSIRFWSHGAMSNHVFIHLFINSCILLNASEVGLRESVRMVARALYFGTSLHKLNSGFFDTSVSCASQTSALTLARFGVPNSSVVATLAVKGSPIGALFTEFALPFIIHTRIGLALAILFHVFLIMPPMPHSFYPFSLPMVACFSLYVKRELSLIWSVVPIGALATYVQTKGTSSRLEYPAYGLHQVAEYWISATALLLLWSLRQTHSTMPFRKVISSLRQVLPAAILTLAFLLPYVGVRVYSGAFAMFSNLRVEGCAPNHFALTPLDAFGVMNDLVKIEGTNIPALREYQVDVSAYLYPEERNYLTQLNVTPSLWILPPNWTEKVAFEPFAVPRIEMRRTIAKTIPEDSHYVDYRRHTGCAADCVSNCDQWSEIQRWTPRSQASEENMMSPPLWWERIFRFRAFGPDDPCRH